MWYPGLPSSPDYHLAKQLFGGQGGGLLSFEVKGGAPAASRVLEVASLLTCSASGSVLAFVCLALRRRQCALSDRARFGGWPLGERAGY